MVLELKVPHGADLRRAAARCGRCSRRTCSASSIIGIYWNNHHHMLHATDADQRRDPVGEPAPAVLAVAGAVRDRLDGREPLRAAADGASTASCCCWPAIAYYILLRDRSSRSRGRDSKLGAAVGQRRQGQALAAALRGGDPAGVRAAVDRRCGIYVFVALMWLVPDRRIEFGGRGFGQRIKCN